MIELPNITLVALTGQKEKIREHEEALFLSSQGIAFGGETLLYMPHIKNIDDWNHAVIYDLYHHIETDYCILIHPDGYIINPELWNPEWLNYDYAGSPWPLPKDSYSYRSESGKIQRVGNSVSLRSKKLMKLIATRPWKHYYGNCNEDGFICCHNREWLESQGCKFIPLEEAVYFGKEHTIPENENIEKTFLFHTVDL